MRHMHGHTCGGAMLTSAGHLQVSRTGLETPFKGGTVKDLAQQTLKLAREGLTARGCDEERFLLRLEQIADTGMNGSKRMLELYETEWGHSVDPIYMNDKLVF